MTRAALYVRASTELQVYSTTNQIAALRRYAEAHGHEIVRTYEDNGRSGLSLAGREGLLSLLQDVLDGAPTFSLLLVYDISRWGRFQDSDESAHYEFLCRQAGVPVVYCAETFANDGSAMAGVMKAIRRTMAAEYSRDLSVKVTTGMQRLAKLGHYSGGPAGLGLRRQMMDASGQPKGVLEAGEYKCVHTYRVQLVLGPAEEVALVRHIFDLFTKQKLCLKPLAARLNAEGIASPRAKLWRSKSVRLILTNERYVGRITYNRATQRLRSPRRLNAKELWICNSQAVDPIISVRQFRRAQELLGRHPPKKTDAELLAALRDVVASGATLSSLALARHCGAPAAGTYRRRFGSMSKAYQLIGYEGVRNLRHKPEQPPTNEELIGQLRSLYEREGRLTRILIRSQPDMYMPGVYAWRFGGLIEAYRLAGYISKLDYRCPPGAELVTLKRLQ